VYDILKSLSERRILHFIPRKKIPHITYTCSREETRLLRFSPEVYDKRKKEFEDRINAMWNYVETDHVCRSRHLLRYFGEETDKDCGQCDVCTQKRRKDSPEGLMRDACNAIKRLLADKKEHLAAEFFSLGFQRELIEEAMEYLVSECQIRNVDGMLRLY